MDKLTNINLKPNQVQNTNGSNSKIPTINSEKSPAQNSGTNSKAIAFDAPKIVDADERINRLKDIFGDKALKQMGVVECSTCASRTYIDGSDDPGVSFKTPGHVSPEASFGAVASHEQEHVSNEKANAASENREVIAQSVQVFTSVCPECGKVYASGGVTKTTTAGKSEYDKNKGLSKQGNLLDAKV